MAIEKEIKITADTSDANKNTENLAKSFEDLSKKAEDIEVELKKATDPKKIAFLKKELEKVNDELGVTDKKTKKAAKSTSFLSRGFKNIGTAIKASGIGLVVSVFAALTAAMSKNQKAIDAISVVFETLGIYLSKVSDIIIDVINYTSESTERFDALGKVLGGLITVFLTPLKLTFYALKLGIKEAQLAWEKSVFGGKDANTIKELETSIEETKNAIVEVGNEAITAGKDVYNNFSEAIEETGAIAKKVTEEVSRVSLKASYEQAKVNIELKNTAKLAVAEQQRLVELYDRQAEQQRQIRDDVSKGIPERKKANEELADILERQEKAMLSQADAQIAAAQAELNKNNNIENQVALTEALANKEGVLAQVEGFRSEQLVNRIALLQEEKDLKNTIFESEQERALMQKELEIELEENELKKLEKAKELLSLEEQNALDDLERKRLLYELDTQQRVDAEQEYLTKKKELEIERTLIEKEQGEIRKANAKALEDAKYAFANNTLGNIQSLLKEGSDLAKGVAVAQATISGIEGVQNAFTSGAKNPITSVFPAFPYVQAGLAGAFSAVQIGKILSTDSTTGGGSSTASSSEGISAPSFNIVEGTGDNQIAQSIQNQNNQPVQAFVVSTAVTSGQSFDRNIQSAATL